MYVYVSKVLIWFKHYSVETGKNCSIDVYEEISYIVGFKKRKSAWKQYQSAFISAPSHEPCYTQEAPTAIPSMAETIILVEGFNDP